MKNLDKTLMELHVMLKTAEAIMLNTKRSKTPTFVLTTGNGGANKKNKFSHHKGKTKVISSNQTLKRKTKFAIAPNINHKEVMFLLPRKGSSEM